VFSGCSSLAYIEVDENNLNYCDINGVLFDKTVSNLVCYPRGKTNTEYVIPNSVTLIGSSAFSNCMYLTSIDIHNSVTSIGEWAFSCNYGLSLINIPNSVTSIGDYAFWCCSSLTSIIIPDSVISIGEYAFGLCSILTSINISDSVTSIGEDAFYNCNNLTIYGYTGSYAETYANENNIPFVSLEVETSEPVEIVVVKLADDGTDEVNVNDLGVLIQIFIKEDTTTMTPEIEKADVYKDGILDARDITMFKRYLIKNANK
jgi:hypothetical protein